MAKVMIMRKICKYFGHKENYNRCPMSERRFLIYGKCDVLPHGFAGKNTAHKARKIKSVMKSPHIRFAFGEKKKIL